MGKSRTPADDGQAVADYLEALTHERKPEIEALRRLILQAEPRLSEHVKWNAPSFAIEGEHRITMRLHPGALVQVVLHRGAKPGEAKGFAFADETGLIRWAAPDRGVVSLAPGEVASRAGEIARIVRAWIAATA